MIAALINPNFDRQSERIDWLLSCTILRSNIITLRSIVTIPRSISEYQDRLSRYQDIFSGYQDQEHVRYSIIEYDRRSRVIAIWNDDRRSVVIVIRRIVDDQGG